MFTKTLFLSLSIRRWRFLWMYMTESFALASTSSDGIHNVAMPRCIYMRQISCTAFCACVCVCVCYATVTTLAFMGKRVGVTNTTKRPVGTSQSPSTTHRHHIWCGVCTTLSVNFCVCVCVFACVIVCLWFVIRIQAKSLLVQSIHTKNCRICFNQSV